MQGLIIKELDMRDLDAVYMIEVESYPAPWSRNFFRLMAHTSPELFLTAHDGDEIIGYTVGEVDTRPNRRKLGHVMNLAVREAYRNRGVGSALMDELERRFVEMGATAAYLEVRESNTTAQKLYSNRSYSFFRKAKGYYGDEDGYVMTKSLEESP
ncbi:MAG: ribosomal protein S18-alanine N-acetyltransferase [Candidatus Bathyarchaeota archaeon]